MSEYNSDKFNEHQVLEMLEEYNMYIQMDSFQLNPKRDSCNKLNYQKTLDNALQIFL